MASSRRSGRNRSTSANLMSLITGRTARVAYVVLGTAGLIALAFGLVGPRRIERVYGPVRDALEPPVDKLWAESEPLRQQIGQLLESASPEGRTRLVATF